jgi:hypothetical protein
MKKLLPAFAAALFVVSCGADSNRARYNLLVPKLIGDWTDRVSEPGAVIHERWQRTDDGCHTGIGFVMVEKDTVFIERLSLAVDSSGAVSYDVRVPSQNAGGIVRFPLTACIGDSMVFANPSHDFPQRIVYALQSDGDWIARVSGQGKDGTPRGFSYRFKRMPS